ncbi:hypothetical protein ABVV53_09965 [Novosphingobium sp. RD2P27]|uniref:O-antigen ligase domain-containing protein n=1 Tax=Novosphingobium kalidii TaxID=3230299 RepID=A0ABV2D2A0_9SPHN
MLLIAALPLFGQTFHYMKDLKPLWALSKAFPLLSLLLVLPVLTYRRVPQVFGWLLAFLWLVLVSSFAGVLTFDQNFLLGLTAQVKLLPMLYALSFLGLLLLVRPSTDQLVKAIQVWAVLTFAAVFLLWAFAPQSWYSTKYEFGDAPLLSVDDRGNRIRMPMYFGLIALFSLNRRLLAKPDLRTAVLFVFALALIAGVVRTRAVVLGCVATLALIAFMASSPRWRVVAVAAAAIVGFVLLQVPYVQSAFDTSAASGIQLRQITADKSIAFLGDSVLRWMFGVGTITPLDPGGLPKFFNHFFFLADISWLGIVFEFGLVGAAIMLILLMRTWNYARRVRQSFNSPVLAGMQDYVLFTLIQSPLYSTMTLQPGEIAVVAAIFVYLAIMRRNVQLRKPRPT